MKKTIILICGLIILIAVLAVFYLLGPKNTAMNGQSGIQTQSATSSANNSQTVQTNKVVSSNASKVTIVISGGLFNPQALTIKKGSTVTWVNKDYAIYTITADNLGPTSQALKYNGTYSYKFNIAGIYGYHLASNPKAEGTVIVK